MIQFRVVVITNNLEEYPEYRENTEEFPEMVPYVEDEVRVFVSGGGDFWPANEFFDMVSVTRFTVDASIEDLEEQIQLAVVRLSDLKLELAEQLEQYQGLLREYVVSKQYPLDDRFETWADWCDKTHHGCVINEADVPLLGKLVEDGNPTDYDRYVEYDWLHFLECFQEDYDDLCEQYGVTVDDVKELLIKHNFGSFRMD